MNGEDFALTRIFRSEGFFYRLAWVTDRSYKQITTWNARLGEQLAIFWLSMPKVCFTIASIVSFVGLNFLISTVYSGVKDAKSKTVISTCLIFAIWPGLEVFFWRTANAEYLQPILLSLICIYFYNSEESIKKLIGNKIKLFFVSFVAFLAGLSFENVPIAVSFYMLMSFLLLKQKKKNMVSLLPIATMMLGWFILITAPSTTIRRLYYKNAFNIPDYSVGYILARLHNVVGVFFSTSSVIFAVSIVALFYILFNSRNNNRAYLAVISAVMVVGSVIATPYTEPRSFLLAWVLMLATVVEATYIALEKIKLSRIVILLLFFLSMAYEVKTFFIYSEFATQLDERENYILKNVGTQACSDGIEIRQIHFNYSYRYINNRDEWYHENPKFISNYYGCKILMK